MRRVAELKWRQGGEKKLGVDHESYLGPSRTISPRRVSCTAIVSTIIVTLLLNL